MSKPKVKLQQIMFTITSAGQSHDIDVESDKLYNTCTGVNVLLTDNNARFSTLQLDVNGTEVFPEHFEVVRVRFRPNAPFGFDYHGLDEVAGGSRIKGKYTDDSRAIYPYTVSISLRLENITKTDTGTVA